MFSSTTTTQTTLNRRQLYRQTAGILNDNSLHFISISFLFLPFTFSASAALRFYFSSGIDATKQFDVNTYFDPFNLFMIKTIIASYQNLITVKTLIIVLTFTLLVILPTLAGVASITYSTIQAIRREPLTFSSAFKSLSRSYIPLLSTVIAGSIKLIFIFLLFTLSPIAVTGAIKALVSLLGFHFDEFLISIFTNTLASYALLITVVFFIVIWGSAATIAVLESKSGFEPLRLSSNQSTEFRSHSFSIVFLSGYVIGSVLSSSAIAQNIRSETNWILILQVVVNYLQSSLMIVFYVVANTVLCVQCKVARDGEIAKTGEGEVSGEYVKVAVNEEDGEGFHEPVKDEATGGFNYMMILFLVIYVASVVAQIYNDVN